MPETVTRNLPVLALRGLTVFPHMSMSLDVEREVSLRALEKAMEGDQRIFLVTQREIGTEAPEERDLYEVGTVCAIRQILKMSGSTVRILVDGLCRAKLCRLWQTEPYLQANVEELGEAEVRQSPRVEALLRRTAILFGAYAELVGGVSDAARAMVLESRDPGALADFIAHNCDFRYHEKQEVLEERDPSQRLKHVNELLARENEVLSLQKEMEGKVRQELEREEFSTVVPDFRLNKAWPSLRALPQAAKDKVEFLCNECCWFGCRDRKACYEAVSRIALGIPGPEHHCAAPHAAEGYRFSKAMENPGFISIDDIRNSYLPMGFSQFKIEGRGLGSALILEFLLYYLTRPEYQIHVREALYLDNMLDLF